MAGLNLASLELWISARHNLRGGEFFLNTFYQSLDYEDNAPRSDIYSVKAKLEKELGKSKCDLL